METTVPNAILQNATGAPANVDKDTLEPENRTITDVDQIFQVSDTLINDWKKGILNAATITSGHLGGLRRPTFPTTKASAGTPIRLRAAHRSSWTSR